MMTVSFSEWAHKIFSDFLTQIRRTQIDHRKGHRIAWVTCGFLLTLPVFSGFAAENPEDGDIRDIKVGVNITALPLDRYVGFYCAPANNDAPLPQSKTTTDAETTELTSWMDYQKCHQDNDGYHHLGFKYDDAKQQWAAVNDKWEGTKISGHPVLLKLLVNASGHVNAIHAATNPTSRAYLRKKAFLLSLRVKARYGRDGWQCTKIEPSDGQMPVGGMFINERCEKGLNNRSIVLHTRLYRDKGQGLNEFTNATEFQITTRG